MANQIEKFNYDDAVVRKFVFATAVWGLVATLVGVWLAVMLVMPKMNFGLAQLSFGRLRPLHRSSMQCVQARGELRARGRRTSSSASPDFVRLASACSWSATA